LVGSNRNRSLVSQRKMISVQIGVHPIANDHLSTAKSQPDAGAIVSDME